MQLISLDVESNGLWGKPFAIGVAVYDLNGNLLEKKIWKSPIKEKINEWVKDNVLPALSNVKDTHQTYEDMMRDFSKWWLDNKEDSQILWHMGHIVEVFLFRELYNLGFIGEFDAPYTPFELAEILRLKGYEPDLVDEYIKAKDISLPYIEGSTHNPLYDAIAAAEVFFDLQKGE